MAEETTTVATPPDGAGAPAQPADGATTTAAQPQEPQSQGQPAQADDTAAWLQSKGVDPNDPEAFQKVAKMAYNSEKQMTKATQEASELKKSLTPSQQQPVENGQLDNGANEFFAEYRRDKLINNFKETHQDWQQYEKPMGDILRQQIPTSYGTVTRAQLVGSGLLSLDDVYAMAKGSAPDNTAQIKAQTQQEVLQTLANTQRAGGGNPQASNPNPQKPDEDPINAAIRAARGGK